MKKKILSGHNFLMNLFQVLNEQFDLTYPPSGYFKKDQILDIIGEYEVYSNFSFYALDKEIIDKAKNLKLIANFGVDITTLM